MTIVMPATDICQNTDASGMRIFVPGYVFPLSQNPFRDFSLHSANKLYICAVWILSKFKIKFMQRRYRTVPELKAQESAQTLAFSDPALAGKLTAMGVLPGTRIEMVRTAPFGKTYYVKVDGIRLALREEEAASILLTA